MNDRDGQGGKRLSKTTGRDGSNRQPSEKPTDTMSRGPTRQNWMMTPDIQNKIGQQLRAVYSDIVDQGVPDRFAKLIDQLEGQTRNSESGLPDGKNDRQEKNKSNEPD
jgi:hypothetical protein